jgi:simple sugar transport system permease protein
MTAADVRPVAAALQAARRVVAAPSVVAVVGALLLSTLVMVLAGISPAAAYPALVRGALGEGNLEYTVAAFVPTLGMAIAFAIPLRMGEFNLGGDGQLALGGIAAAAVALQVPLPPGLGLLVPLLAAAAAGSLLGALAAPLHSRLGIPAIVSTLLLSAPAVALASYLARFPLAQKGSGIPQTEVLPDSSHLPALGDSPYVTLALPLVLVICAVWLYVDSATAIGYRVRATGQNREFARYGGVEVGRLALGTLAVGGGLAGVVGGLVVMTSPWRFIDGALTNPGYTFTGLAAVLLATGRPFAVPFTVALLTVLQVGGEGMERDADVPRQLTQVIEGLVVVIVAVTATAQRWPAWLRVWRSRAAAS